MAETWPALRETWHCSSRPYRDAFVAFLNQGIAEAALVEKTARPGAGDNHAQRL
jgi:hypothetical protein